VIRRRTQIVALVTGAALLAAVGCGSEEEGAEPGIPRGAAEQLSRELDLVQERVDVTREQSEPGSCGDVESKSYPDIERILDGLPDDTDPDVRRALDRSVDRLRELTDEECSRLVEEIEERRRETAPPATTPPPAPVQPEPGPPETETDDQREEEPKEEEKPNDDEREDGLGGPNGQGPPGQDGGGLPAPPPQGD
jgi:hypothetical protein